MEIDVEALRERMKPIFKKMRLDELTREEEEFMAQAADVLDQAKAAKPDMTFEQALHLAMIAKVAMLERRIEMLEAFVQEGLGMTLDEYDELTYFDPTAPAEES